MDRPSTSKSRGICKYFLNPRGCENGDSCKFLHGETDGLTPYDKSKTCRFYAAGFCRRGAQCWFRHIIPPAASRPTGTDEAQTGTSEAEPEQEECGICYEKPDTYGLLGGCSHAFCLKCLRDWRDPAGKSEDVVESGNTKKCPLCRAPARFITPSSIFFPSGHARKTEITEMYKASMARVPCRHFQKSRPNKKFCPFGRDCFYQHLDPDGSVHDFTHDASDYISHRGHYLRTGDFVLAGGASGERLRDLLHDLPLDDLSSTVEGIRANLTAMLMSDMLDSDEVGDEPVDRLAGQYVSQLLDALERLQHSVESPRTPDVPVRDPTADQSLLPLTRAAMPSNSDVSVPHSSTEERRPGSDSFGGAELEQVVIPDWDSTQDLAIYNTNGSEVAGTSADPTTDGPQRAASPSARFVPFVPRGYRIQPEPHHGNANRRDSYAPPSSRIPLSPPYTPIPFYAANRNSPPLPSDALLPFGSPPPSTALLSRTDSEINIAVDTVLHETDETLRHANDVERSIADTLEEGDARTPQAHKEPRRTRTQSGPNAGGSGHRGARAPGSPRPPAAASGFVTDGRGRVIRTVECDREQEQARAPVRPAPPGSPLLLYAERPGSPRAARAPPGFMTDGRGRVIWTVDGQHHASDGECEDGDAEDGQLPAMTFSESDAGDPHTPPSGRPSILQRVLDRYAAYLEHD